MAKSKWKNILIWIAIGLAAILLAGVGVHLFRMNKGEEIEAETNSLNKYLREIQDNSVLTVTENLSLIVEEGETVLGFRDMKNVTIDGEKTGVITATGAKESVVRPVKGGTLTFKNLTITDATEIKANGSYMDMLWLGGRLRFENCTFKGSIYLKENIKATFVNCTFESIMPIYYSVWVGDGYVRFDGCTFKGYRGLKVHEFDDKSWADDEDVKAVIVRKCLFDNISEKPGIAIGDVDEYTAICITDSVFDCCIAWDKAGSLVGVNGFYECDTPLDTFSFTESGNSVPGFRYSIKYKMVVNGATRDVEEEMFKNGATYATTYTYGESATVDDLQFIHYTQYLDYAFEGWYLDKACTVAFEGTDKLQDNITLYAKIAVAEWSPMA